MATRIESLEDRHEGGQTGQLEKKRKAPTRDGVRGPAVEQAWGPFLNALYQGTALPCPVGCGGISEVVRVATLAGGSGQVWLECLSCAQREGYEAPAPAAAECEAVQQVLDAGQTASCVRHARRVMLLRRGRRLVCPECGVRYRE